MNSSPNGGTSYRVDYSKAVGLALRRLHRRARLRGQGKACTAAFRQIVAALQKNPGTAGEPLYRLPKLRVQLRTVVVALLVIDFSVNEDQRIVWIKSGKLLSTRDA